MGLGTVSLHVPLFHSFISLIADLGVKVLKLPEGLHNKGFLLTMDNGVEVFAKLPNPNAGPAHYTTACEVATREFVSL